MALDLVKHESDKMRLLKLAYESVKESADQRGEGDYTLFGINPDELIGMAKLPEANGQKLISDLQREGLLRIITRHSYTLTGDGIRAAERYIYESSALAKRRKFQAGVKGLLGKMFTSTASQAASLAGAFIAGVISRDLFPAIVNALKAALSL